ncbi:MAG: DUF692 domain-containing protein [Pseudomonadota bacterium]|nr:DUF692 domain-containing protein [Pseudomonadota bacterium]
MRRLAAATAGVIATPADLATVPAGTGIGLRRALLDELLVQRPALDFLELAPENWIGLGGRFGERLTEIGRHYPLIAHGLSLSLGGPDPLDARFLHQLRTFLDTHGVRSFSDHLAATTDGAQLYDLMPLPFAPAMVRYVADRIRQVQDVLGRRIAIENPSYYLALSDDLTELDFLLEVLEQADCDLLLDVNNVYVNAMNHGYDAEAFIAAIPPGRVRYLHVAGHRPPQQGLRIDTHAEPVAEPVWALLTGAYRRFGPLPTLLERDGNLPPLTALLAELAHCRALQQPGRTQ